MFCAVSSAKSPRIVPGAASCGRVAPLIARTTAIAFGPSSASGDERRRRDEVDQAREERLLAMRGVMALRQRALDVDELEPDDLEPALLVPRQDPTDQLALDAIGLHEDEGAFSHGRSPSGGWSAVASSAAGGAESADDAGPAARA